MTLSLRDKQRTKWALLVLVGGASVLYAVLHLLIRPLMQSRVEALNKLAECQERIDRASADLHNAAGVQAEVARLRDALSVATNRYVIQPILGSTLVTVQNVVEPMAAACGLQIDSFVERGRNEVPVNKKDAVMTIERYLMEISAVGSYASARGFLQEVEKTNIYVCVTDVEILGRNEDPARHRIRICMEWPVFGPNKAPESPVRSRPATSGSGAEEHP